MDDAQGLIAAIGEELAVRILTEPSTEQRLDLLRKAARRALYAGDYERAGVIESELLAPLEDAPAASERRSFELISENDGRTILRDDSSSLWVAIPMDALRMRVSDGDQPCRIEPPSC